MQRAVLLLPLLTIACGPRHDAIVAQGTIEVEETDIVPTVRGRISHLWVEEGAIVYAGDTVASNGGTPRAGLPVTVRLTALRPAFCRWLSAAMPMTFYLEVIRSIALKGAGLAALVRPALILTASALVLVTASVRRFTKTMA